MKAHTSRPAALVWLLAWALSLAACGAAPAAAPAAPASAAPVSVRLGFFPNVTHAPALVGVARGLFAGALGEAATLETKTFNACPALIEALFAGELDIAYIGPNPAINGYVKSEGAALRIIAGAASGGAAFVVRSASGIERPEDLAGKKLATPQLGNTQDVALRYYLQQHGLATEEKGGTVQVIPTQNPDILRLFQQGTIDGAWVPEPWAARLVLEGDGRVLLDERDIWPDRRFVTTNIIVSKAFLDAHPDQVAQFLAGHLEAVAAINADLPAARETVNAEIERITTKPLPAEVLERSFATIEFTYDPLAATLFASADHAFALGFLGDEKPDLSAIYDLGPLNRALAAKGMEQLALP